MEATRTVSALENSKAEARPQSRGHAGVGAPEDLGDVGRDCHRAPFHQPAWPLGDTWILGTLGHRKLNQVVTPTEASGADAVSLGEPITAPSGSWYAAVPAAALPPALPGRPAALLAVPPQLSRTLHPSHYLVRMRRDPPPSPARKTSRRPFVGGHRADWTWKAGRSNRSGLIGKTCVSEGGQ